MGPSGAPSALRGPQCFAKAHVENPWENIGERRFLEVPLCYVRDGIRGEQFPDIFEQKTLQNSGKTSESGKTYYAANPKGPSGAPSAPRGHKSSPRAHVGNPWENKGKLRFRVVPLCRVRGGISGEGFPDSNELAAKFFGNQCFSHVISFSSTATLLWPLPGAPARKADAPRTRHGRATDAPVRGPLGCHNIPGMS